MQNDETPDQVTDFGRALRFLEALSHLAPSPSSVAMG